MFQTITQSDIVRAVSNLPDDATLDDAFERLFILHKIERGLKDAREGQTMTQDEVEAYFRRRRASPAEIKCSMPTEGMHRDAWRRRAESGQALCWRGAGARLNPIVMKLGDVLKKEREKKGLAQSEVAKRLQLSEEAYRQLEAGRAPGGWAEDDIVQRFARAVGTPPELIRNKIRDL